MRISLVGNVAVGKTRLARKLSLEYNLPVTHVDTFQFNQHLQIRPMSETRIELKKIEDQASWIIDGHGPLDMLEPRFRLADKIYFLDPPLHVNIFWLTYRHAKNILFPRKELPFGSSELRWSHIKKSYRTLWTAYHKMRPELYRMLSRDEFKAKTIILHSGNL